MLGDEVADLAIPTVAILVLGAGAFELGILNALTYLPFLVFGLLAGGFVDRIRRRPVLIAADSIRALVVASIPIAFAAGLLHLWLLYVVAFLSGTLAVFFDVAYQAYLPSLVGKANLVEGNTKLTVTESGAALIGPALAGVLIQVIGSPLALGADAFSFLISSVSVLAIRAREAASEGALAKRVPFLRDIGEGLRFVFGHPVLRPIMIAGAIHNFGGIMVRTVFFVFAYRQLHLTPAALGLIFALGAFGLLFGAMASSFANRVAGVGPTLLVCQLLTGVAYLLIPLASLGLAFLVLVVSQLLLDVVRATFNITAVSLRQAVTPDHLLGRMTASYRTVIWGVFPLGALAGGIAGTRLGLVPAIVIGGLLTLAASTWLLTRPVYNLRAHPAMPSV
jgi:MFS family permease